MNEIKLNSNISNICQTCLRDTRDLYPMCSEIINLYRNIVYNVEDALLICTICQYMFKKFIKFLHQCSSSSEILKDSIKWQTGYHRSFTSHYPKLVTTEPVIYHLGPDISDDDQVQDSCDFTTFDDNDEVPLVMLRSDSSVESIVRRKKKKKKKDIAIKNAEEHEEGILIKEEYELGSSNSCEKENGERKPDNAGEVFTTRMVRETNEYVVIKLTKDQVLEEMQEKAKSDAYLRAPYKCKECAKGFNFEEVLATHMIKHTTENGLYLCDICSQYCPTPVSLRGHMKSHTTRYKCKVCGHIRLSRQHLLEHYAISHTSEAHVYRCVDCLFTTNKRTVIQKHVKSHGSREHHSCHHCGKMFKTVESLRIHVSRHDKSRRFECSQCGKAFLYPSLLHKHVRDAHERDDHYCVECDVKFKSSETLRLHFKKAKRHRDSSSYKYACAECPERFASGSALSVHRSAAHGAARQQHCASCGRSYGSAEALRAHIWRAHAQTPRQQPSCPLCHKTFSRNSIVKAHMRTHTGERPFVCECGAAFAQRATLRAHAASKHRQKQDTSSENMKFVQNESDSEIKKEANQYNLLKL